MNTKRNLILLVLFSASVMGAIVIAMATILSKPPRVLTPGETLPDRDIVFIVGATGGARTLGFINADGSGYTTRNVVLPNWRKWRPFTTVPVLDSLVTWGYEGEYLISRYSFPYGGWGIPLVIHTDGTFTKCPDDETSPYSGSRSWGVSDRAILTVAYGGGRDPDKVVVVDMTDCKVVSTLYTSAPDESIGEATLSSQGWWAMSRWFISSRRGDLAIMNSDATVVTTLPEAGYPTWSPDGEWLAYSFFDDDESYMLYVLRKDGTDARKLADARSDIIASWSPDGQWLVYSRDNVIYKFNLAEGKEYELFKGGYNPDWRK